jgi:hypothetical protein
MKKGDMAVKHIIEGVESKYDVTLTVTQARELIKLIRHHMNDYKRMSKTWSVKALNDIEAEYLDDLKRPKEKIPTIENPLKSGKYAKYDHERIQEPSLFDKHSLRIIPFKDNSGRKRIIGCPIGHYDKKTGKCKVGTQTQAILTPKITIKNPVMQKGNDKIHISLPLEHKGIVPLSFIGYVADASIISIKRGKPVELKIKSSRENPVEIWESYGRNIIIIKDVDLKEFIKGFSGMTLSNVTGSSLKDNINQVKKNYASFTWRKPDTQEKGTININPQDDLIYVGSMSKLYYLSDKFDKKPRKHTHDFENPHMVLTNRSGNILICLPCKITTYGIDK